MTSSPRPAKRYTAEYLLYGIGGLARQLASVVMVPVYTRVLSPADYGAVELVLLLSGALFLVAGMNLGEGLFRFSLAKSDSADRRRITGTALTLSLGLNLLGAVLLTMFAPMLTRTFIAGPYSWALLAAAAANLVTEGCISIVTCHMRAEGDAGKFFMTGILRLGLQIGVNLFLLVYLRMGAMGMVLGGLLSTLIVALCILPYTLRRASLHFSPSTALKLISFGAPLVIANVASFYLQSSDRFFLSRFRGLAEVGVYALAWRLAQAYMTLIHDPFEQIWEPEKYRIWSKGGNTEPFRRVFRLLTAFLIFCGTGISLFSAEIFHVLASKTFAGASSIAPILIAAALFTGLARYCRFGSLIANRTENIWRAAWISAVTASILLLVLVPRYGAIGAALAATATAATRLIVEDRLARRFVDLKLPWLNFGVLISIAAVIVTVGQWLPASSPIGVSSKFVILILFAAGIWFSGFVAVDDRAFVMAMVRRPRRTEVARGSAI